MEENGLNDQVRPDRDLPVLAKLKRIEIDLNKDAAMDIDDPETVDCYGELSLLEKVGRVNSSNCASSRGLDLDLNMEDISCSGNQDHFNAYENYDCLKSREISECGSAIGGLEERDSMRIWMDMKRDGFVSSSYGCRPLPVPKHKGKNVNKGIAERVNIDEIAKTSAPSGLLKGLNPGILNHVRNRKQVRSIIETMLQSENLENGHRGTKQTSRGDDGNQEVGNVAKRFCGSQSHLVCGNDRLEPQLSSLNKGSKHLSSVCEESTDLASVSSLSVTAANVALRWLEFLHQDIKRRLAALRQSKERVHAVITIDIPLLVSKQFSSNQEKEGYVHESPGSGYSSSSSAEIHEAKWSERFKQMHETLCEEEKLLETWLNQVVKLKSHCQQGIDKFPMNILYGKSSDYRTKEMDCSEKELTIMAAAASIYSTCAFVASKEKAPC